MYERAPTENEYYSSIRDIFRVIWKRLWVIVLVAALFTGAAAGIGYLQKPVYDASAQLLVGQKQIKDPKGSVLSPSDVQGLQQLTQTMTVAVDSKPIAEQVIKNLHLRMSPQQLLDNLKAEQVQSTQFIQLDYRGTNPERARDIVNAFADVSAKRITDSTAGGSLIVASVWERATTPVAPSSPRPLRNGALALGLGVMFGLGLVFLLEHADDSWRSVDDIERASGVPSFGVIPQFAVSGNKKGT
nr:Wzz/FepE/Etk N-terminal domain-containing protein [Rubrobacter calidifluminis]